MLVLGVNVSRLIRGMRIQEWVRCECKCGRVLRLTVEPAKEGLNASDSPNKPTAVNLTFDDAARNFAIDRERPDREPKPQPHAFLAFGASVVAAKRPGK